MKDSSYLKFLISLSQVVLLCTSNFPAFFRFATCKVSVVIKKRRQLLVRIISCCRTRRLGKYKKTILVSAGRLKEWHHKVALTMESLWLELECFDDIERVRMLSGASLVGAVFLDDIVLSLLAFIEEFIWIVAESFSGAAFFLLWTNESLRCLFS